MCPPALPRNLEPCLRDRTPGTAKRYNRAGWKRKIEVKDDPVEGKDRMPMAPDLDTTCEPADMTWRDWCLDSRPAELEDWKARDPGRQKGMAPADRIRMDRDRGKPACRPS